MMTLQGWRQMYKKNEKDMFMESRLWRSFSTDWIWELAVVDSEAIKRLYQLLDDCEQQVVDKLLDGLLLHPRQEQELITLLSQSLCRPRRQVILALQAFAEAGLICMLLHPWQGGFFLMPLPIFHNLRVALRHPLDHPSRICLELPDYLLAQCTYAHSLTLGKRFIFFTYNLSQQVLAFTKQGMLSKALMKQMHKQQQQLSEVSMLDEGWRRFFPQSTGGIESLMLELALDLDLLRCDSSGLEWNRSKLDRWLTLPQRDQDELIWHWLLQHVASGFSGSFLAFNHDVMMGCGNWVQHDQQASEEELAFMNFLSECGFLSYVVEQEREVKEHGRCRIYARREQPAVNYDQLHLQNNGELLALPGTRPKLIWQALEAAELIDAQETLMFRITPASIGQATARGYTNKNLVDWLKQWTDGKMPVLVEQMFKDQMQMSRIKDSIKKEPLLDLHSYNKANAQRKTGHDEGKQQLPLIEKVEFFELRDIKKWGYFCSNPLGILLDASLLNTEQLKLYMCKEKVGNITRNWQSELRHYHSSTIQQIVEAAIQYGLGLYVKRNEKLHHLVPQKMAERNGRKILLAAVFAKPSHKPLEIELSEIEAIRLDIDTGKGA